MHDEYLRPADAAKVLSVSISTLAKWRMRNVGPAFVKVGSVVRYSRNCLEQFRTGQGQMGKSFDE